MSDTKSPLDILITVMRERFDAHDFDAAVAIAKAVRRLCIRNRGHRRLK